ncbi:MAG: hypothetical protein GY869_15935, partial [Planctomycetes bacterium]|nr:hypothetical protein [Planctomycetota bacterium]
MLTRTDLLVGGEVSGVVGDKDHLEAPVADEIDDVGGDNQQAEQAAQQGGLGLYEMKDQGGTGGHDTKKHT